MSSKPMDLLNITDLSFVQLCSREYGVNRGVYNVIDLFLYNNGVSEVRMRRKTIINFLEYCKSLDVTPTTKIKFGHGGLSDKLERFWKASSQSEVNKRWQRNSIN